MATESESSKEGRRKPMGAYGRLAASLAASLAAMFFLAFSQLDSPGHFRWSLSVFWMSLSMVSTMGLIMVVAMPKMVPDRRVKGFLGVGFAVLLVGAFSAGRVEAGVDDDAFLRSMIPHHSRAIHMCQQADLSDPEVQELCRQIIESQSREIRQMEQIIDRRG